MTSQKNSLKQMWLGPMTDAVCKSTTPDVLVRDAGTVFTFCPLTPRAKKWIAENIHLESWQWFGNALVVEHRYALPLVEGMIDEGLVLG